MSLDSLISSTHKEIAGSRTKNRLTVQISYAIILIMEFYSTDFLVMMDYIEDISIIKDPDDPSSIHLYQVKTKSADKQYALATVISDKWFQKLYANAQKYGAYMESASVVCNTDIVTSLSKTGTEVFSNEKTALDDASVRANIQKIQKAIAEDQGVEERDIDLSKFFFVRTTLSTKGHREETEYKFQEFLLKQDSELQVATAKSIFRLLYSTLDAKFNEEISETCTDTKEIFQKKGLLSNDIKSMISCGLAVQIPPLDKLFSEFEINSPKEKRMYSARYRQIKLDMYNDMRVFANLKHLLIGIIEQIFDEDIYDMPNILAETYRRTYLDESIPLVYREEFYLKTLVMILAFKYCYGGENV